MNPRISKFRCHPLAHAKRDEWFALAIKILIVSALVTFLGWDYFANFLRQASENEVGNIVFLRQLLFVTIIIATGSLTLSAVTVIFRAAQQSKVEDSVNFVSHFAADNAFLAGVFAGISTFVFVILTCLLSEGGPLINKNILASILLGGAGFAAIGIATYLSNFIILNLAYFLGNAFRQPRSPEIPMSSEA